MRSLLAFALLATCLPLQAQPDPNEEQDQEPPFSYLFMSAAMTRDRDRELDVTSEGFSVGGSVDLAESLFLMGSYSSSDTGEFQVGATSGQVESDGFSVGVGGHRSLTRRTDLTGSLGYVRSMTKVREIGGAQEEDRAEGFSTSLSLRHLIHPWIEVGGGPSFSFIEGQRGWDWSGGLAFLLIRDVWMDVDYYRSAGQDSDGWSLGLRTVFGN